MGFDLKFLEHHCPPEFDTFIETGSHYGDTISRALMRFRDIYSIELCQSYHEGCKSRFSDFKKRVNLYLGDSAVRMADVVEKVHDQKCLVFLDAHYSCESDATLVERGSTEMIGHHQCPAEGELEALKKLSHSPIIIIDNIQMFEFSSAMHNEHLDRLNRDEWPEFDVLIQKLKEIDPTYVTSKVPNLRLLKDPGALPPNNEEQMVGDLLIAWPGHLADKWGIVTEVNENTKVHYRVNIADAKTGKVISHPQANATEILDKLQLCYQENFVKGSFPSPFFEMAQGMKVGEKKTQEFSRDPSHQILLFRESDTLVTLEIVYVETV
jgi:hypothetical protein